MAVGAATAKGSATVIKVCELVWRRPDLELEAFRAHWRDVHGPIVAAIPGIRRYVQSHPLIGGYRRGSLPFDGLAEIWVEDKAALRAMAATPEFAAAKADEPNFIDTARLVELVVDEVVVKDGPIAPAKSIELVRLRADRSPEEGHRYWAQVHGPIAATIPQVSRYVQSHLRPGAYGRGAPPFCDGLAVTWFESVDAMRASAGTEAYARTRADEANFLAPADPQPVIATELVLVG